MILATWAHWTTLISVSVTSANVAESQVWNGVLHHMHLFLNYRCLLCLLMEAWPDRVDPSGFFIYKDGLLIAAVLTVPHIEHIHQSKSKSMRNS